MLHFAWCTAQSELIDQFAPTEDLAAYPRTLDRDLDLLRTLLPPSSSSSFRGLGVSESDGSRPDSLTPVAAGMDGVRGLGVSENDRAPASISPSGAEGSLQAGELGSLVVFAPAPDVMYPLKGDLQDLKAKRGVEVDVKGWGDVMEGASRRMSPLCITDTGTSLSGRHGRPGLRSNQNGGMVCKCSHVARG